LGSSIDLSRLQRENARLAAEVARLTAELARLLAELERLQRQVAHEGDRRTAAEKRADDAAAEQALLQRLASEQELRQRLADEQELRRRAEEELVRACGRARARKCVWCSGLAWGLEACAAASRESLLLGRCRGIVLCCALLCFVYVLFMFCF
jgi:hypothetical protein